MPKRNNPKKRTERQKKLIFLILENFRNPEKTETMYSMMLKAGYSETSATEQATTLAGIKDDVSPIVNKLKDEREKAIKALSGKMKDAKYRDLVDAIDKFTKNAQLLSGKSTDNSAIIIKWEK